MSSCLGKKTGILLDSRSCIRFLTGSTGLFLAGVAIRCDAKTYRRDCTGKMRKIDLHPAEDANPRVAEQDLKEIKKWGLDLLIAVEVNPIPPEIPDLTRFGVLTLHFGADTETARQMPGLREVMEKQSVTQTFLAAHGGIQPLPEVISAGTWFTHPLSPARHRSYYFWAAAALLPRALQHLQSQGYGNFVRAVTGSATLPRRSSAAHRQYGNLQVIRSYIKTTRPGFGCRFFQTVYA